MPLDDDNEDEGVFGFLFGAIKDLVVDAATYKPEIDPDEPRDPGWLRWLKFLTIILIPAFFVGLICFGVGFLIEYHMAKHFPAAAIDAPADQVTKTLKHFFECGAAFGGLFGLLYVIRCLIRKVDP